MAGLDSIAQAAGRCNREGLSQSGDVVIFLPEDGRIPKVFRRAAAAAESVLRRFDDPFAPEAMTDYFKQVYWLAADELDTKHILDAFQEGLLSADFPFRTIAEKFRLIETQMTPVIIPWDATAEKLIRNLEFAEFPRSILRQLQSYTIQIYEQEFDELDRNGVIKMVMERYPVMVSMIPYYDESLGVYLNEE